jgi:hypothetical protein
MGFAFALPILRTARIAFQSGHMAHHRHVLRSQNRFERLSKMELT